MFNTIKNAGITENVFFFFFWAAKDEDISKLLFLKYHIFMLFLCCCNIIEDREYSSERPTHSTQMCQSIWSLFIYIVCTNHCFYIFILAVLDYLHKELLALVLLHFVFVSIKKKTQQHFILFPAIVIIKFQLYWSFNSVHFNEIKLISKLVILRYENVLYIILFISGLSCFHTVISQ